MTLLLWCPYEGLIMYKVWSKSAPDSPWTLLVRFKDTFFLFFYSYLQKCENRQLIINELFTKIDVKVKINRCEIKSL